MGNSGNLDGFPVELYDGRFSGKFELDEEDGRKIGYDDVVAFLVVTTADKANFDMTKLGEVRRTNTFGVSNVRIVPSRMAEEFLDRLNGSEPGEGYIPLEVIQAVTPFAGAYETPVSDNTTYDTPYEEDYVVTSSTLEEEEDDEPASPYSIGAVKKSKDKTLNNFLAGGI